MEFKTYLLNENWCNSGGLCLLDIVTFDTIEEKMTELKETQKFKDLLHYEPFGAGSEDKVLTHLPKDVQTHILDWVDIILRNTWLDVECDYCIESQAESRADSVLDNAIKQELKEKFNYTLSEKDNVEVWEYLYTAMLFTMLNTDVYSEAEIPFIIHD